MPFGKLARKNGMAIPIGKKINDTFIRFDTTQSHERDRRTDRHRMRAAI